jgi:hypothetical protein
MQLNTGRKIPPRIVSFIQEFQANLSFSCTAQSMQETNMPLSDMLGKVVMHVLEYISSSTKYARRKGAAGGQRRRWSRCTCYIRLSCCDKYR